MALRLIRRPNRAPAGALPGLRALKLQCNTFGPAGAAALGACVRRGALRGLQQLCLNDNPLGDVEGFWAALRAGSMPCLVQLYWYSAGLGDAGLAALAQALGAGALPALKDLFLQENAFGDVGLEVRPLPAYCLHPLPEPHPAHRPQRA